jgi:hypothetical protein
VWTPPFLLATIKCDHGYTSQSRSVRHFVDVLCELSQAEQRTLLRFVTGSPRLPPGGLAALRPPLTIVMKQLNSGAAFQAMTCISPKGMTSSLTLKRILAMRLDLRNDVLSLGFFTCGTTWSCNVQTAGQSLKRFASLDLPSDDDSPSNGHSGRSSI